MSSWHQAAFPTHHHVWAVNRTNSHWHLDGFNCCKTSRCFLYQKGNSAKIEGLALGLKNFLSCSKRCRVWKASLFPGLNFPKLGTRKSKHTGGQDGLLIFNCLIQMLFCDATPARPVISLNKLAFGARLRETSQYTLKGKKNLHQGLYESRVIKFF